MKKLLILLFLFSGLMANAQKTELGIIAGVSLYSGDISPKEFGLYFQGLNPAIGFFGRVNATDRISGRLSISHTKIDEDDNNIGKEGRGLNFRTNILEAELMAEINLFRLGDKKGVQVVPYLMGGVGVFKFNPQGLLENTWIDLQPLGTEGQGLPTYEAPYSLTQINIPLGGGLKFIFKEKWTLGVELTARKLFTDQLDDVSSAVVNYLDILDGNGQIAADLSNKNVKSPEEGDINYSRGGKFDDWYYFANITLSFRFGRAGGVKGGRGLGCPDNF